MGINGQRINPAEMAARQYSVSVKDKYIIIEIPVGAVGGYFKVSGTKIYYYIYMTWVFNYVRLKQSSQDAINPYKDRCRAY